jgi:uncharacterized protein
MKRILTLFLLAALTTLSSQAAPPSRESIDRLLVLTKIEKVRDAVLVQIDHFMRLGIQRALQGQTLTLEDQEEIDAINTKMSSAVRDSFSLPMLRGLYEKAYAETFTQEEVDGLIAFYGSPTGQAFAEKQPLVIQNTTRLIQQRLGAITAKIQTEMRGALEELQAARAAALKHGSATPPPAAPATPGP